MGKLAVRYGVERLILAGALALTIGLALIPFVVTVPQLVGAMTLAALGFSIITPALNTAISVRGEADVQGGLMGVTRSASTLSRMIGPAIGGATFGFIGIHTPYISGAIIMVAVAFRAYMRAAPPPVEKPCSGVDGTSHLFQ